jgi:hypothetical protein
MGSGTRVKGTWRREKKPGREGEGLEQEGSREEEGGLLY